MSMRRLKGVFEAAGIGAEFGTAATSLFAVVFLYVLWLFIRMLRTTIREWATAPSSETPTHGSSPMPPRNVWACLDAVLTEPPTDVTPAYRWGMLAMILALLAVNTMVSLNYRLSFSSASYGNFVVVLMLLLNHVSGNFRFSRTLTLALRVLAWGWLVLGCSYICFLLK